MSDQQGNGILIYFIYMNYIKWNSNKQILLILL